MDPKMIALVLEGTIDQIMENEELSYQGAYDGVTVILAQMDPRQVSVKLLEAEEGDFIAKKEGEFYTIFDKTTGANVGDQIPPGGRKAEVGQPIRHHNDARRTAQYHQLEALKARS